MITIRNLQKRFGEKIAIDIPNFTINNGDILGLVGNNGAGKTTLFRLILDLLKADSGQVILKISHEQEIKDIKISKEDKSNASLDITIAQSEEWKKHISAYIDEGFLIDFLTAEEYFAFLGKIAGLSPEIINERIESFEHFSNGEIFGQKKLIRNLSAGNKQKVGIVSAFLCHPEVVILDEPFNFLDPTSQNILKRIIIDYNRTTGGTVIISSHNLSHTVDICSRITLLEHGMIIRDIPNNNAEAATELKNYFETE